MLKNYIIPSVQLEPQTLSTNMLHKASDLPKLVWKVLSPDLNTTDLHFEVALQTSSLNCRA